MALHEIVRNDPLRPEQRETHRAPPRAFLAAPSSLISVLGRHPHRISPVAQRTTGAFHAVLERNSFEDAVLVVQRSATPDLLTADEVSDLIGAFRPLVADIEARARVKRCSIVPVSVVVAACSAMGRTPATVALLQALQQVPRVWELALEQVALASTPSHVTETSTHAPGRALSLLPHRALPPPGMVIWRDDTTYSGVAC